MKISVFIVLAVLLVSASCHLRKVPQEATQFITKTIVIQGGSSQDFSNPLPFTVDASCKISTNAADQLCGTLSKGNGKFNGKPYSTGEDACFTLTNGETLSVEASGGAEIKFTNKGQETVTVTCDASLLERETSFISKTLVISAHDKQKFSNPMFFSVHATCTITVPNGSEQVCGQLVSGTGSINGESYSPGQSQCYTFTNGEQLKVEVGGDAQIDFSNPGSQTVSLNCEAGLYLQQTSFIQKTIVINSKATEEFSNPLPFSAHAKCTSQISSGTDQVCGKLIKGSGEINGDSYSEGQSVCYTLTNGQVLDVKADGHATFSFTNNGLTTVSLSCDASLMQEKTDFLTKTIVVQAHQAESFSNPLPMKVKATCTASIPNASDKVCGKLTKGSGSINGIAYTTGEQTCFTLTDAETIAVEADGSAAIQFTNDGSATVTLTCDANLLETQETEMIKKTIVINSKQTESFSNPLPFGVSAKCTVTTTGTQEVVGKLTAGSGEINGQSYSAGQSVTMDLTNSESIDVKAGGNSTFSFTNNGSATVTLDCDASLFELQTQ